MLCSERVHSQTSFIEKVKFEVFDEMSNVDCAMLTAGVIYGQSHNISNQPSCTLALMNEGWSG